MYKYTEKEDDADHIELAYIQAANVARNIETALASLKVLQDYTEDPTWEGEQYTMKEMAHMFGAMARSLAEAYELETGRPVCRLPGFDPKAYPPLTPLTENWERRFGGFSSWLYKFMEDNECQ